MKTTPAKNHIATMNQNVVGSLVRLTKPRPCVRAFPAQIEIPATTKKRNPSK